MKTLEHRYRALQRGGGDPSLVAAYARVLSDIASVRPIGAMQRQILEALSESRDGLTFAQLVERTGRSQPRVREMVDSLCARGLMSATSGGDAKDGPWQRTTAPVAESTSLQGRPALARARVMRLMSDGRPRTRADILEVADLPPATVSAALSHLESIGAVRRLDARRWQAVKRTPAAPTPPQAGETKLHCQKRNQPVSLTFCLDEFNEAHVRRDKENPCWGCRQGAEARLEHCWQLPVTPRRTTALLAFSQRPESTGRLPSWVVDQLQLDPAEFEPAATGASEVPHE